MSLPPDAMKHLVKLAAEAKAAEQAFGDAFEATFPPGASVSWDRNGLHHGTVDSIGYSRISVRNERTGATYWIYPADVMRAMS